MLTKNQKVEIVNKFGKNNADTGSTEVQVALLSERINTLTDHLRSQPKDFSSRRGLLKLVGQRRNFMNYLKNRNSERYTAINKKTRDSRQVTNTKLHRRLVHGGWSSARYNLAKAEFYHCNSPVSCSIKSAFLLSVLFFSLLKIDS